MFQDFTDISDPSVGVPRVAALREKLLEMDLDGFIIPHGDEHRSEFLPPSAERLRWLTGFSGSAGAAVVLMNKAAIFVDGRYTLQIRNQTDASVFEYRHLIDEPVTDWLAEEAREGAAIGFDPWLHSRNEVKRLEKAMKKAGARLVAANENPIDAIWIDRPDPPLSAAFLHPLEFSGQSSADKIAALQDTLTADGIDAAVLTMTESLAWLFNIRGSDVAHKPLVFGNAILPATGRPTAFIDGRKLSNSLRAELEEIVEIQEPEGFRAAVATLGLEGKTVRIDPAATPVAVVRLLEEAGATLNEGPDPCELPRAIKNATEIDGARAAQKRDGAAFVRFLAWLDRTAGDETLTEIDAARKLEAFRAETGVLEDIAFDTISGAGPNGAIVHYRVSESSNRRIEQDSLYLIDAGAQYRDGTTDVTRTVAIGTPTAEMIRNFTLVLKGMIAISIARFPKGTTGAQLDTLARIALWKAGLDYDHGTGHGVGSFLGVHEGPQRLAKTGTTPLEAGMILSNEPGYYHTGAYGIRIENLVVVTPLDTPDGGVREMHGFETLTLAPIDRRLIDPDLLTSEEIAWLDAYHRRVRAELYDSLPEEDRAWLDSAAAPLGT